ncbi:hypothetical protein C5748_18235 [Phyllobacterium phragmitis]|uniref:Uncharacterized protein n=1 Tax=Phyllobacterium phragmitis TaxID=2670329 RepID=A0A2S9INI9_9HYPH|nr:hypothetical protein C5748_18235 [Phyllobacterium phragmitis]
MKAPTKRMEPVSSEQLELWPALEFASQRRQLIGRAKGVGKRQRHDNQNDPFEMARGFVPPPHGSKW